MTTTEKSTYRQAADEFIDAMTWQGTSEGVKTLVIGNINGFVGFLEARSAPSEATQALIARLRSISAQFVDMEIKMGQSSDIRKAVDEATDALAAVNRKQG